MNATTAINKIVELLGLKFKKENFYTTMLIDGTTSVTNNMEGEFQVGQTLYVVGEATLTPAPEGTHVTREGLQVTVDSESTITRIEEVKEEVEVETETEASAEEAATEALEASQEATTTTEEMADFPWDECMLKMMDEYGDEDIAAKVCGSIKAGNMTQFLPKQKMSQELENTNKQLDDIKLAITELLTLTNNLNGKFKTEINEVKEEFEKFKKQPQVAPIEKKISLKENFDDYRVDLLKQLRNK